MSGINGLCFLLLTISMLNYGTRLETIVKEIKIKEQHLRATNQLVDQMTGYSGASSQQNGGHQTSFNRQASDHHYFNQGE